MSITPNMTSLIFFVDELFTQCKFILHPLFDFFVHVKHLGVFLVDIFTVPNHDYTVKNCFLKGVIHLGVESVDLILLYLFIQSGFSFIYGYLVLQ